jgi:hypothetical protein
MIQSSFPKVADQIITYNKNIVDILSKLNSLATTTDPTISIDIIDENGNLRSFTIPTNNGLKADIERLNANITSLYSLDAAGSMISTSNSNKFKKIITVDLNREPVSIGSLNVVSNFKAKSNWFFDSLMDPMISVEFDLSDKIGENVSKCLSRRYIIDFSKDESGNLTTNGLSAQRSFDLNFKGNASIDINEFEQWYRTTPGIVDPLNPKFDEEIFDLEPNSLLYDGVFTVLRIQEDRINRKLWYVLDTLDYLVTNTNSLTQLSIGNEIIVNSFKTSTKYKIVEVSRAEVNPRIRVERVEGIEPIPVGIGTLKIYSPVIYSKKCRISVGFDERNVIFLKPINTENNLVANKWSLGTGFYTPELTLDSNSDDNGLSMDQFYQDYVYDYGQVLKDLVAKKTPNRLAGIPNIPVLNLDNFKVVQINSHLTDTPDSNLIKQRHNIGVNLKSELDQLQNALSDRIKKTKFQKFKSDSDRKKAELEVINLEKKRESKFKQLETVTKEIIDLSKSPKTKVEPKFRVRGFWAIPEAVSNRGTKPQEVIQFKIQWRYISKDGREAPIETFKVGDSGNAAFSNWNEMKTDVRKRTFDSQTGEYFWQIEDVESADTPNINQIDIPIQVNEIVEIRVKSISEVGWPESPAESEWSEIVSVAFPDDLNNVLNENDFILQEASRDELRVSMSNELSARGLDKHLSEQVTIGDRTFNHTSATILSGFRDSEGNSLDLFQYLQSLQDRIKILEEKIDRAKGELEVVVLRNNQEFVIQNGSETVFNIECEDYLQKYEAPGAPTGRVYQNTIYVIKDFVVRVRNKSLNSPLGLLSGRNYLQSGILYDKAVPQVFWVNDKDELITSDSSGVTRTQINNQFIWSVNYDSITDDTATKLSENIGNVFNSNNSITGVLSNNSYNIGYSETGLLNFVSNNKSLLETSKWIDTTTSVASTNKLLTTIHPVVSDLENITEKNSQRVKTLNGSSDIIIPINIYFKMNSLDPNQKGLNYEYVNLNGNSTGTSGSSISAFKTVKHIKKLKFFLENESENRPFEFRLKFNINRNKVILKKVTPALNLSIK